MSLLKSHNLFVEVTCGRCLLLLLSSVMFCGGWLMAEGGFGCLVCCRLVVFSWSCRLLVVVGEELRVMTVRWVYDSV